MLKNLIRNLILSTTLVIFCFTGSSVAQEFNFLARHSAGTGMAEVRVQVVSPDLTTGDDYRVTFEETSQGLVYNISNATTQTSVMAGIPVTDVSPEFDGLVVSVKILPFSFEDIAEVQFGDTAVNPPVPVFRPGDHEGEGGNNSTDEYTFVAGVNAGIAGIAQGERNTNGFDYEMRFDGNPAGRNYFFYFLGQGTISVPFSLWNIGRGTPDDTTDDYQIIAIGFDDGGQLTKFDGGAVPRDGGPGTMYDRIFAFEFDVNASGADINNDGEVNYDDVLQDLENNGGDIAGEIRGRPYFGDQVLSHFCMVALNDDPDYLPPVGTTIRITTTKPPSGSDEYMFTAPQFGLFTEALGFNLGGVRIDNSYTLAIQVRNASGNSVNVSNITFAEPAFQAEPTAFAIAPGASQSVNISFSPSQTGFVESGMTIASDDVFWPQYSLTVAGEALPAFIEGGVNIVGRLDMKVDGVRRNDVTDVWGYHDIENQREYALVGYGVFTSPPEAGLKIVDVTEPFHPMEVASLNTVPGFDVKAWQHYAYTVNGTGGGNGGIVDISEPADPQVVGSFPSSHNIFITESGYMILESPAVRIFDLNTDPVHPSLIWQGGFEGHDAAVVGDVFYDFHGNSGTFIYDFSNPADPQLLSVINDPTIHYHHSGWPTKDGNYLYITDELSAHPEPDVIIFDISDPANPQRVAEFGDSLATVHNLFIIDDFAYLSYYNSGYKVFDVSDPLVPALVGAYDTEPNVAMEGFDTGAFGVYPFAPSRNVYVSDYNFGLFIFAPQGVASAVDGDETLPEQFVVYNNYPNPFNPETVISFDLPGSGQVQISIFNTLGQEVRKLLDEPRARGYHSVVWDGKGRHGTVLPSGVYFYKIKAGGKTQIKRMLLLK